MTKKGLETYTEVELREEIREAMIVYAYHVEPWAGWGSEEDEDAFVTIAKRFAVSQLQKVKKEYNGKSNDWEYDPVPDDLKGLVTPESMPKTRTISMAEHSKIREFIDHAIAQLNGK